MARKADREERTMNDVFVAPFADTLPIEAARS